MTPKEENKKQKKDRNAGKKRSFHWTKNSIIAIVVIVVVAIMIAAGAVQFFGEDRTVTTDEKGVTYKYSPEIELSMSNLKSSNPMNSTDLDTYYISHLVYDGLFDLDETMTPVKNLAKSYSINKKNKRITINLVNTKFHNGQKLTSYDVEYTVEALKAAGTNNYSSMVSNIYSIIPEDDHKVTVSFNEESKMRLSDLTFPIMPRKQFDGVYTAIYKQNMKMVGTGPYKMTRNNGTTGIRLKAYDDYHGEKAQNNITFSILTGKSNKYKMTEASNISTFRSTAKGREAKIDQSDTGIVDFPANEVEYIGFNFLKESMTDKNIRKAIATAIDNKTIIQECYYNSAMINDTIYYPNYLGFESNTDKYAHNQDKAEKYLAKAGYKDRDSDGFMENESYGELSVTLLTTDGETRQETAEMIQKDLQDIGIHVYISYAPEKSFENYLKSGNFDIFLGGFKYSEDMDMAQLLKGTEMTVKYVYDSNNNNQNGNQEDEGKYQSGSSGNGTQNGNLKEKKSYNKLITGLNYTRYYNKQLNEALDKMNNGEDVNELRETFREIHDLLISEVPYYCVLYKTYGMVKAPSLEGEMKPTFWNVYNNCETWKSKYEAEPEEEEDGADVAGKSNGDSGEK